MERQLRVSQVEPLYNRIYVSCDYPYMLSVTEAKILMIELEEAIVKIEREQEIEHVRKLKYESEIELEEA